MARSVVALAIVTLMGGMSLGRSSSRNGDPLADKARIMAAEALGSLHAMNGVDMEAGRLAFSKGSTPEIRRFGDRLARDQQSSDTDVRQAAERLKVRLTVRSNQPPDESLRARKALLQQLHDAPAGAAFDRAFLSAMELGNRQLIEVLKMAAVNVDDRSFRALAEREMPILQQHVDLATLLLSEPANRS